MTSKGWRPISTLRADGEYRLFFSPGNPKAGNENAHRAHMVVDVFSARWPKGRHQLPEAPYTLWQPLPEAP
jgi:hypothetical protein